MLNILGTFPAQMMAHADVGVVHRRIETMRLGYADIRYVADPQVQTVPLKGLISPEYARKRAASIDPERAHCDVKLGDAAMLPGETAYLTAVDRDGTSSP
jgi:gamma-glutamyltranspeptidase/glutathione hydrolase